MQTSEYTFTMGYCATPGGCNKVDKMFDLKSEADNKRVEQTVTNDDREQLFTQKM